VLLGAWDRFELVVLLKSLLSGFELLQLLLTRKGLLITVLSLVGLLEPLVNEPLQEVVRHDGLDLLRSAIERYSLRRLTLPKLGPIARLLLRQTLKLLSGLLMLIHWQIF
jgi:hypothetical protein